MLKFMRWLFVIPGNAKRAILILAIAIVLVVVISLIFNWSGVSLVLILAAVLARCLDIRDYERRNAGLDCSLEQRAKEQKSYLDRETLSGDMKA
jgi:hypothetical protein